MKLAIVSALALISLSPAGAADPGITSRDKLRIATKIYASVESRFGHWQAIPGFDLDKAYQAPWTRSPPRTAAATSILRPSPSWRSSATATARSRIGGSAPPTSCPASTFGCRAGSGWCNARRPGLEPGDVVVAIDGKPTGDFVAERIKYMAASSARGRQTQVFFFSPLWPQQFEVTLAGGRRVQIDHSREPVASEASRIWVFAPRGSAPDDVAYLPVPTFNDPRQEQNAVEFLKTHKDAPAVIIDLRGNGGGSTPEVLIRAIMDRPWPGWIESTSVLFPLFRTYGERFSPKDAGTNPRSEGYLEAFAEYFNHPFMMLPEPLHPPENPVYTGRVILIADLMCGSACEDFVMPLKFSGRATVVGETTGGSSGQPYMYDFGNGMLFRVGTKRTYFPDGSEFEGVGIKPDIEVIPTPADIKAGRSRARKGRRARSRAVGGDVARVVPRPCVSAQGTLNERESDAPRTSDHRVHPSASRSAAEPTGSWIRASHMYPPIVSGLATRLYQTFKATIINVPTAIATTHHAF